MDLEQTSRFIDVGAQRIHIIETGPPTGEPVLLLHGFPEFWWAWRHQMPALAEAGFRVVAMDMRGYGESEGPDEVSAYTLDRLVEDVAGVAQALDWERFNLVGHDWGGIVAWAFAARHPLIITRLIILNAPHLDVMGRVVKRKPIQLLRSFYIGFFQVPRVPEALLAARHYRLLRAALSLTSRRATFAPTELDRYTAEWAKPGRLRAMLHYYRALAKRSHAALGRIVPPTLILWGCKDRALDNELAKASLLQCTNGRMCVHRNASHWIHVEEPQWVNTNMIRFLLADHELDRPEPGLSEETA